MNPPSTKPVIVEALNVKTGKVLTFNSIYQTSKELNIARIRVFRTVQRERDGLGRVIDKTWRFREKGQIEWAALVRAPSIKIVDIIDGGEFEYKSMAIAAKAIECSVPAISRRLRGLTPPDHPIWGRYRVVPPVMPVKPKRVKKDPWAEMIASHKSKMVRLIPLKKTRAKKR